MLGACQDGRMAELARPAATIVLVRDDGIGPRSGANRRSGSRPEVLVMRRSAGARFASGFVVFPGGAVDQADADLAMRWFGSPDHAARACAVRELAEETGLLLTASGVRGRRAASTSLGEELERLEPPGPDEIPEIARWIAPDFLPTRFDAQFFASAAAGDVEAIPNSREAEAVWWTRPSAVLRDHRDGTVELAWPTFKTLEALAGCASILEVLALRIEQVPPPHRSHVAPRPPGAGRSG
jgi:8-oxo-dGTP pyrophosphatase MutT (NUDIX family)